MAGIRLSLWTFLLILLILILLAVVIWITMIPIRQAEEMTAESEVATPDKGVVEQAKQGMGFVPPELKAAHNTWFKGLLVEDTTMLEEVLSDEVTFGWPEGGRGTKEEFLSFIQSGRLFYDTAEHVDVRFRVYGNTAVVTGRSNLAYRIRGNEDFERLTYTAVYVITNGVWKMVAWQSTRRPQG